MKRWAIGSAVVAAAILGAGTAVAVTGHQTIHAASAGSVAPESSSTTSTTAPNADPKDASPAGPKGWLLTNAGTQVAQYLTWTTTGAGNLIGTVYTAQVDGTPPNAVLDSQTNPLSGTVQDSTVTLQFGGDGLYNENQGLIFGSLAGDRLTLTLKTDDGSLGALTFYPATPSDYNQQVSSIRGQTSDANATAAAEQQAQQAAAEAAQAALPACGQDAAATAAQGNGAIFRLDCVWPDGHSLICTPYSGGDLTSALSDDQLRNVVEQVPAQCPESRK